MGRVYIDIYVCMCAILFYGGSPPTTPDSLNSHPGASGLAFGSTPVAEPGGTGAGGHG